MKNAKKSAYYVYIAYGVSGEVLYVGKGTGDRYKHCLSGASNCRDLNKYYFQNGEEGSITVTISAYFDNDQEALDFEKEKIIELLPLFNKDFNPIHPLKKKSKKTDSLI